VYGADKGVDAGLSSKSSEEWDGAGDGKAVKAGLREAV